MDSLSGTREAPGKQERTNWTACKAPGRHQGGRKGPPGPFGRPGRRQGDTREAGRDHLDSLGGTREAGKDQLDSLRGTREKTHLLHALPTTKPAELKLLPLLVHKCEELNNQITASIFWKKNAQEKTDTDFEKKNKLEMEEPCECDMCISQMEWDLWVGGNFTKHFCGYFADAFL